MKWMICLPIVVLVAGCVREPVPSGRIRHSYDANTLFDYIDGEADVYVKAGLKTVKVWNVKAKGYAATVDVYHMQNPKAADKVYTTFANRKGTIKNGFRVFFDGYQTIAVKGSLFLRVKPAPGSEGVPGNVQETMLKWVLKREERKQ